MNALAKFYFDPWSFQYDAGSETWTHMRTRETVRRDELPNNVVRFELWRRK